MEDSTHLEPQAILLHRQIAHLAQIPRVDITPGIPHPTVRDRQIIRKLFGVFVRLNDVSNAEGVDVGIEALGEGAADTLAAHFGDGVGVCGVTFVGVCWSGLGLM